MIDVNAAALILVPCWLGVFLARPYIGRKLGFDFPKAPRRPRPRTEWARMFVTGFFAFGFVAIVAVLIHRDLFVPGFLFLWVVLYYASPLLTKRLPYFGFSKTDRPVALPTPKRPLWRRLLRGSLATTGFVVIFVLLPLMILLPLSMSHIRARRVHDSIHTGMTAAEVLHTAHDYDIFQASSDLPTTKMKLRISQRWAWAGLRMAVTTHMMGQQAGIRTSRSPRPLTISTPACTMATHGISTTPISMPLHSTSPSSWTSVPTVTSRKSDPSTVGISGTWSESLDLQSNNPTTWRHNGPCHCAGLPTHHCRRPGIPHGAARCDSLANAVFQLALFEPTASNLPPPQYRARETSNTHSRDACPAIHSRPFPSLDWPCSW